MNDETETTENNRKQKKADYMREWRRKNFSKYVVIRKKYRTSVKGKLAQQKQRDRLQKKGGINHRSESTRFANNHAKRWTIEEIRIVFDETKTDYEIASILGRSMNAVQHVRAKYIKQIKPGYVSRRNKRKDFTFYAPPIKGSAE